MDPKRVIAARAEGPGAQERAAREQERADAHVTPPPVVSVPGGAEPAAHPHVAAPLGVPKASSMPPAPDFTQMDDGGPAGDPRRARDSGQRLERLGERTEDFVDSVESAINQAVPGPVRHRRNPRQNTIVNVTWRALVLLVGLSLLCLGVVLLVLPGPGWATILLGLVILASEYTWANRLLEPVRRRVKHEAKRVRGMSRGRQLAIYLGCGVASAVLLILTSTMLIRADWSWLP